MFYVGSLAWFSQKLWSLQFRNAEKRKPELCRSGPWFVLVEGEWPAPSKLRSPSRERKKSARVKVFLISMWNLTTTGERRERGGFESPSHPSSPSKSELLSERGKKQQLHSCHTSDRAPHPLPTLFVQNSDGLTPAHRWSEVSVSTETSGRHIWELNSMISLKWAFTSLFFFIFVFSKINRHL